MGVGGQRHAPAALSPGKTRCPLYRRMGGPQGRSGRVRKISPPPGFDPRTVQPVSSRYTDWAIAATSTNSYYVSLCSQYDCCKFLRILCNVIKNLDSKINTHSGSGGMSIISCRGLRVKRLLLDLRNLKKGAKCNLFKKYVEHKDS
jgi:hypothetical protein